MFVAYGTSLPLAAAAVVGYRVFQLGLPALFGAVALVRSPAGARAPAAAGGDRGALRSAPLVS